MRRSAATAAVWIGGLAAGATVSAVTAPDTPAGRGPDAVCRDCHDVETAFSHPVGVVPSMDVPPDLPLPGGRIACLTCHDAHREPEGRPLPSRSLCGRCHDQGRHARSDLHAMTLGVAHLRWPDDGRRDDATAAREGDPDPESFTCVGCHDGAVAAGAGERSGPAAASDLLGRMIARHPVGALQTPRGAGDHLLAPDRLDPRIRLYDGRVGCGSCHSLYGGDGGLLVMSNRRSALCLGCHGF